MSEERTLKYKELLKATNLECKNIIDNEDETCSMTIRQMRKLLSTMSTYLSKLTHLEDDDVIDEATIYTDVIKDAINEKEVHVQHCRELEHQRKGANNNSNDTSLRREHQKLPQLELPKFYGDRNLWPEFIQLWNVLVDSRSDMSELLKFSHLKCILKGDAARTIDGLPVTEVSYKLAIDLLKERFGDDNFIQRGHFNNLKKLSCRSESVADLRIFYDSMESNLRAIEAKEPFSDDRGSDFILETLVQKLPKSIRVKLVEDRNLKGLKWNLSSFRILLRSYLSCREEVEDSTDTNTKQNQSNSNLATTRSDALLQHSKTNVHFKSSAQCLAMNVLRNKKICAFCDSDHWSDECMKFKTKEMRVERIKLLGLCFKCLVGGHIFRDCSKNNRGCFHCKDRGHHSALCNKKFSPNWNGQQHVSTVCSSEFSVNENSNLDINDTVSAVGNSDSEFKQRNVHLQLAKIEVRKPFKKGEVNIMTLLDSGSDKTYISEEISSKLGLKPIGYEILCIQKLRQTTKPEELKTAVVEIDILLKNNTYKKLRAHVISSIVNRIPVHPVDVQKLKTYISLEELSIPVSRSKYLSTIDLLIGADYYDQIVNGTVKPIGNSGLFLRDSLVGKIICGTSPRNKGEKTYDYETNFLCHTNHEIPELQWFAKVDEALKPTPDLHDLWSLESIGINEPITTCDDDQAIQQFQNSVKKEDNRYFVKWPKKDNIHELPENRELALGRLKSSLKKLSENPDHIERYNTVIEDQIAKGIIEEVKESRDTGNQKHYIPHHAVITPQKQTTKIRIVYDASAKTKKGNLSLNECMYRGPVMLPDLCSLLIKLRLPKIAILADIEKAFLQVGLQIPDRDLTRFFWIKDIHNPQTSADNLKILRFTRVPFGVISSPFLLSATVKYLLQEADNKVSRSILSQIYVDNVMTGCETTEEGWNFYSESKKLFNDQASMNLREYMSNDASLMQRIPEIDRATGGNFQKVLGINWNLDTDCISIAGALNFPSEVNTKREMLQATAKIFDPLGYFSPIILQFKILVQKLWKEKISWDTILPDQYKQEWKKLSEDVNLISEMQIERHISKSIQDCTTKKYSLICFTDASKLSYSAVIYLKCVDESGKSVVRLLFSKSRLAPVSGKLSIPRLELMGVLIGTRAVDFVMKALTDISIADVTLFTDAQCVLDWLKTKKPLERFVEKRIEEIKKIGLHRSIAYRHVSGSENPADIASRGTNTKQLMENELWWSGPKFISENDLENTADTNTDATAVDGNGQFQNTADKNTDATAVDGNGQFQIFDSVAVVTESEEIKSVSIEDDLNMLNPSRFSSLHHLYRITGRCFQFIEKLKGRLILNNSSNDNISHTNDKKRLIIQLEVKHIERAKLYHDLKTQKTCFSDILNKNNVELCKLNKLGLQLDKRGLIRCHGRMANAELTEGAKFPKLLPRNDPYTELIIKSCHHKGFHCGTPQTLSKVREEYWVVQGRSVVKKVLFKCVTCKKWEGGPYTLPKMPHYPEKRVKRSSPFTYVGVDNFGPVYVIDRKSSERKKIWICLFTCMVTRAIHLELLIDLSAISFINCLKRFISRRGKPKEFMSDNFGNFTLTSKIVKQCTISPRLQQDVHAYLTNDLIDWKFITQLSPWMGGVYERLIGCVKRSLKKTLGKQLVDVDNLHTLVVEIEGIINSRPLVYTGVELEDRIALCPNDFISGRSKNGIQNIDDRRETHTISGNYLRKTWKMMQEQIDQFWNIWYKDYLINIRERKQINLPRKKGSSKNEPRIGDVVLIGERNMFRGTWKLGRISELITSHDGLVRRANVRTVDNKTLCRPLGLLYPLEVD